MDAVDAAVVGSGVVGAAVARALAEAGLRVAWVAARGSGELAAARGGLLDPGLGRDLPAALRPLARRALERLRELEADGAGAGLAERGLLELVPGAELAQARARSVAGACRLIPRAELGALAQRLAPDVEAALFAPGDAWVAPERLLRALASAAAAAGVRRIERTAAAGLASAEGATAGVLLESGELLAAGDVVLCGDGASVLAPWPGGPLPLAATREVTHQLGPPALPLECALVRAQVALIPDTDGELWFAAAEPEPPGGPAVLLPELAGARAQRTWHSAVLRTPDGLPLVGRLPADEGSLLVAGFAQRTALFAVLAADWIRELLVHGELPPEAALLDPGRLAAQTL